MAAQQPFERFAPHRDNLLLILHDCQSRSEWNYVSESDMRAIAAYLNIPLSSVYGVVTYYSMLSAVPRGRHIIRVCDSPICHMEGSEEVIADLTEILGIDIGETTEDRTFTLEHTECLGQCASAPTMLIDDVLYGGLDKKKIRTIIERYRTA